MNARLRILVLRRNGESGKLLGFRRDGGGAGVVEGEEVGEDFGRGEGGGPAVGGEYRLVQRAVGVREHCGALVVEVGEGELLEVGLPFFRVSFFGLVRIQPVVAEADEFAH